MNIDEFFYEHPVFRYEEFASWKSQIVSIKDASIKTSLRYYVKTERIKPVRRKLYAVIPPNQTSDSLNVDPYLISGKITEDAVLGYHTALELMGAAYSIFGQYSYITEQKSKPFEFQGQWFQAVKPAKALQKSNNVNFGIKVIERQGVQIKITNPARTFVDVLDRIELSGGWEEVYRSISNIAVLDINEVIQYSLMLKNARLAAKVGYFLSQRQGAFAVTEKQLAPLLAAKPKIAQYTSTLEQGPFQYIKQWNIFLPVAVIQQSWEEPDADI